MPPKAKKAAKPAKGAKAGKAEKGAGDGPIKEGKGAKHEKAIGKGNRALEPDKISKSSNDKLVTDSYAGSVSAISGFGATEYNFDLFKNEGKMYDEEEYEEEDEFSRLLEEVDDEFEERPSKQDDLPYSFPSESGDSIEEDAFDEFTQYFKDQQSAIVQRDFFRELGRIPSIGEISIDCSIARFIERLELCAAMDERTSEEKSQIDEPILEMEEQEEEREEKDEQKEEEIDEDGEVKIAIEDPSSTEISLDFDFEFSEAEDPIVAAAKAADDENLFDKFLELEEKPDVIDFIDYELMTRMAEERQILEDTTRFLTKLVDLVVEEAEYVDEDEVLRGNLNKVYLFRALQDNFVTLLDEQKVNTFIMQKVCAYFRRTKNFRPMDPEVLENYEEDKRRYLAVLDDLNCVMGREISLAHIVLKKNTELEQKESEAKKETERALAQLRFLMINTFAGVGSQRLNAVVEGRLREMSVLRKQISEARCTFIVYQHAMARLQERMSDIENLGPGLHLRDYEALQVEVFALVKKIEEKTDNLHRFRNHFNRKIHVLAHSREKESIDIKLLGVQRSVLEEVLNERQSLRDTIFHMKKSRVHVKKQIWEMSYKCGLIDKPALCLDYDETLERCEALRKDNKTMRERVAAMEEKLKKFAKYEMIK